MREHLCEKCKLSHPPGACEIPPDSLEMTKEQKDNISQRAYNLFAETSGAKKEDAQKAMVLFDSLKPTGLGSFETAAAMRQLLIDKGFQYDDNVFCLQEMLRRKRGNCLGLTLLYGAELERRSFRPEYQIILHPLDADSLEKQTFEKLYYGQDINYDHPALATQQAKYPQFYFGPREHPSMVLDNRPFETTGLEAGESPEWSPQAESVRSVNFEQVASNVYIDRVRIWMAKADDNVPDEIVEEMKRLALKTVELWPDNREAWGTIQHLATATSDHPLDAMAKKRYAEIGGDDSKFYYTMYKMTGEQKYLDLALERYPAYLEPFIDKRVVLETNQQDARFNLAVASFMAANSTTIILRDFYRRYGKEVERLFGTNMLKNMLSKLRK